MRLSVGGRLLVVCFFLFFCPELVAQCKCTCRPSPPGGTTTCDQGQIAVCGTDSGKVCEGKCVNVSNTNPPVPYAAVVLSGILEVQISEQDLFGNRAEARAAIEGVLT